MRHGRQHFAAAEMPDLLQSSHDTIERQPLECQTKAIGRPIPSKPGSRVRYLEKREMRVRQHRSRTLRAPGPMECILLRQNSSDASARRTRTRSAAKPDYGSAGKLQRLNHPMCAAAPSVDPAGCQCSIHCRLAMHHSPLITVTWIRYVPREWSCSKRPRR